MSFPKSLNILFPLLFTLLIPFTNAATFAVLSKCSYTPNNLDYVDISLVDGFNILMDFSPTTAVCNSLKCAININSESPSELQAPGGCNNPCTVFKANEYCCTDGPRICGPTTYSIFFKDRCPDAYSYPQDDPTSLKTCPAGANYAITFCP
ncbi:hypothetical protein ACSBR2_038006 [Camellia fascicularis]